MASSLPASLGALPTRWSNHSPAPPEAVNAHFAEGRTVSLVLRVSRSYPGEMSEQEQRPAPVVPLRPVRRPREPLWRDLVGDVLRRERRAQHRTLQEVADTAGISMAYLSEIERGRKEASSEVLAAAARALRLGLADLLVRVHAELARPATPAPAPLRRGPVALAA